MLQRILEFSGHRVTVVGDGEKALDALEESFERRQGWIIPFLALEPMLDPLRGEPRFEELIDRIAQAGARQGQSE